MPGGCSAAATRRCNAKIRHYGLNPGGGTRPKIDTSARGEFLLWVVESFGRVHPALTE